MEKEIYKIGKEIFNYLKDNFKVYTVEECKQLKDKGAFGVIYITQCKVNNKLYIGQKKIDTKDFTTYLGSGKIFKQAVDKYGKENFERIILEVAYSQEELNDYEVKYIELFEANEKDNDLFYNIALGGNVIGLKGENHPMYGKPRSEESKKKQSESLKGHEVSEETRKRMSDAQRGKNHPFYGKHLSEEHRKNISEGNKGKYIGENNPFYGHHHTEETKKKQSEALCGEKNPMYGKNHTEETKKKQSEAKIGKYIGKKNGNAKLLICIFPDGRIIKGVCMKELAEELKTTKDTIRSRLNSHEPYKPRNKHLKHLEGIIIMYQEDYLDMIENQNQNINDDNKAS